MAYRVGAGALPVEDVEKAEITSSGLHAGCQSTFADQ